MSVTLSVKGYSSKDNPEFNKHYRAVEFCINNELSFPAETTEFFKGRVDGEDLDAYERRGLLEMLENGIEESLIKKSDEYGQEIRIKVSDIPRSVQEIVIKMS